MGNLNKLITFLKRYHFRPIKYNEPINWDSEWWYRFNLLPGKKYAIFRWDISFGQGALMFYLVESFMWAKEMGYIPVVAWGINNNQNTRSSLGGVLKGDLWGRYYANPSADEVLSGRCILVAAYDNEYSSQITSELLHIYKFGRGYLELESPEWRRIFANYNKYFSQEFILNADFAKSIQDEWENISCSSNRMLAVILREDFSIDRGLLSPDDCRRIHPWVKRAEDTLGCVEEAMTESGCDKIYLCTQFSETTELFTEYFGSENVIYDKSPKESFLLYEKELIRKSRDGIEFADIYDEYQNNPNQRIEKYDIYLRTMYLAAKCDSMIGQQCGGTRLALALNGGKYRYYSMIPNEREVKLC